MLKKLVYGSGAFADFFELKGNLCYWNVQ